MSRTVHMIVHIMDAIHLLAHPVVTLTRTLECIWLTGLDARSLAKRAKTMQLMPLAKSGCLHWH